MYRIGLDELTFNEIDKIIQLLVRYSFIEKTDSKTVDRYQWKGWARDYLLESDEQDVSYNEKESPVEYATIDSINQFIRLLRGGMKARKLQVNISIEKRAQVWVMCHLERRLTQ